MYESMECMKIIKTMVYICSDGTRFSSKTRAANYEKYLELKKITENIPYKKLDKNPYFSGTSEAYYISSDAEFKNIKDLYAYKHADAEIPVFMFEDENFRGTDWYFFIHDVYASEKTYYTQTLAEKQSEINSFFSDYKTPDICRHAEI